MLSRACHLLHLCTLLVLPSFLILKGAEVVEETLAKARQLVSMGPHGTPARSISLTQGQKDVLLTDWRVRCGWLIKKYASSIPSVQEAEILCGSDSAAAAGTDSRGAWFRDDLSVTTRMASLPRHVIHTFERRLDDPSFWVVFSCAIAAWLVYRAARSAESHFGTRMLAKRLCADNDLLPRWMAVGGIATAVYLVYTYSQAEAIFFSSEMCPYYMTRSLIPRIQVVEGLLNLAVIWMSAWQFTIGWTLATIAKKEITTDGAGVCVAAHIVSLLVSAAVAPLLTLIIVTFFFWIINAEIHLHHDFAGTSKVGSLIAVIVLFLLPFIVLGIRAGSGIRKQVKFCLRWSLHREAARSCSPLGSDSVCTDCWCYTAPTDSALAAWRRRAEVVARRLRAGNLLIWFEDRVENLRRMLEELGIKSTQVIHWVEAVMTFCRLVLSWHVVLAKPRPQICGRSQA